MQKDDLTVARFILTDSWQSACTLTRYPEVSLEGHVSEGDGEPEVALAMSQLATPTELGEIASQDAAYTLKPGATAAFFIAWFAASSVVCEYGQGFYFNSPADASPDDSRLIDFPFGSMCDGLFYVSQVLPPGTQI